jgi:hypothetical protein
MFDVLPGLECTRGHVGVAFSITWLSLYATVSFPHGWTGSAHFLWQSVPLEVGVFSCLFCGVEVEMLSPICHM